MSVRSCPLRFMFSGVAMMALTACSAAAAQPTGLPATTAMAAPTTSSTADAPPDGSSIRVGLVTDTGGVHDQAFNQLAWEGVQRASNDMGFQTKALESEQAADNEMKIESLAAEGYDVIITIGASMGEATAVMARQHPDIHFAIVDHAYSDGNLANVTSLMFAEDQVGFLAGVVAGGMSKSGFVCSVSGLRTPESDRYVTSFMAGATWQAGSDLKIMNNYINLETSDPNVPNFDDPTQGRDTALQLIDAGCDVVFGVGGDAVSGALLAAKERNLPAVGADVDQYNTDPEVQDALLTSAQKNVDVMLYNFLRSVADGTVTAGITTGTLHNGGVGLAPFHSWDSRIPAELKAQVQQASDAIQNGSIQTNLP